MTRHKFKKALSFLFLTTVFSITTFSLVSVSSIVNSESVKFVPMLSGGPSPSAAWTYGTSYYHTFTHNQLRTLNNKYQSTIRSFNYVSRQYEYSDRTQLKLTLIISTGSNTKLLKNKDNYQFYYCKKEIHELGVITVKSPFENDIRIYDKERTICDCLKKKAVFDEDMVLSAVKQYFRETGNDYAKLLNYAEILKIRDTVKQYMEVLI